MQQRIILTRVETIETMVEFLGEEGTKLQIEATFNTGLKSIGDAAPTVVARSMSPWKLVQAVPACTKVEQPVERKPKPKARRK